jgi:hypothetical protein
MPCFREASLHLVSFHSALKFRGWADMTQVDNNLGDKYSGWSIGPEGERGGALRQRFPMMVWRLP